jgi:hypothetical protein
LRWRAAALEQPAADPSLPFFIEWAEGSAFPGRVAVTHPAGAVELVKLEVRGHVDQLTEWLGRHQLPITVREGHPAIERVVVKGPDTEIVVGAQRTTTD